MMPQREQPNWDDIPGQGKQPQQPAQQMPQHGGYAPAQHNRQNQHHQPAQYYGQPDGSAYGSADSQQPQQYGPGAQSNPYQYQDPYAGNLPSFDPPANTKSSKKKKIIAGLIAGAAVLAIGGGSAAAYYGYVLPNKPDNVLLASMAKTFADSSLKSVRYEGAADISGPDIPEEIRGFSFTGELADSGASNMSLTLETAYAKPKLDFMAPNDKSFFLRLSGISGIDNLIKMGAAGTEYEPLTQQIAPILAELNDQWYEIDSSLVSEASGMDSQSQEPPLQITDEDKQKLADAYQQNKFLKVIETLPDEDINGSSAKHYKVEVQKVELISFVRAVKGLNLGGYTLTDKDVSNAEAEINKTEFSKYPVELWIDKATKYLTQAQAAASDEKANVTVRVTLKDHNADIQIKKPDNAKSVMELMGQIAPQLSELGGFGAISGMDGGTGLEYDNELSAEGSPEVERKTDVNAMAAFLEIYFNDKGGYPSDADMSNAAWMKANFPGYDGELFKDPSGVPINSGGDYTYQTTGSTSGCNSPTDATGADVSTGTFCEKYVIMSKNGAASDIVKYSLN